MNQTQRNFLIDRIEKETKIKVEALRESLPQKPSLSIHLLHEVMSGSFEIINQEKIKEIIKRKALKSTDREDWSGNNWHRATKSDIVFSLNELFIIPESYKKLNNDYKNKYNETQDKISYILSQSETLIIRIKLASNKTLETLISEIDDMGNISLMETKIKEISNNTNHLK